MSGSAYVCVYGVFGVWLGRRYLLSFMKLLNIPSTGWTGCMFPCWKYICKGKIRLLPWSLCTVPCRAPSPCHAVPPGIDSSWAGLQLDLTLRESHSLVSHVPAGPEKGWPNPSWFQPKCFTDGLGPKWGRHLLIFWIMQSRLSVLFFFFIYKAAFPVKWLPGNLSFLLKIVF